MGLETRRRRDIDIEWINKNEAREFRYTSSKKDIGRDMDVDLRRLLDMINELTSDNSETKDHEIGKINPKFHSVEPRLGEKYKKLNEYIDSLNLPRLEDEEEKHLGR